MGCGGVRILLTDVKLPPKGVVTRPYVPLDNALLCVECESVFEAVGEQKCPACGSHQAVTLRALSVRRAG